jgi:uncharacterized membrane protein
MQEVVDWLNIALILILAGIVMGIALISALIWTPFLLLGIALDYYESRKRLR